MMAFRPFPPTRIVSRASVRSGLLVWLLAWTTGCISLSYDEPPNSAATASASGADPDLPNAALTSGAGESGPDPNASWPSPETDPAATPAPSTTTGTESAVDTGSDGIASEPRKTSARRETPTRSRLARQKVESGQSESAKGWRALMRLARESQYDGKFDDAERLLGQAALQLADRRPTHTPRRTVFNQRARLALDLITFGKVEQGERLADVLFEEARREPELAGPALATLARRVAARRTEAAQKDGREDPQLALLALALETSEKASASRDRLNLAFDVSGLAQREGDLPLARRAIEQALLDAEIIEPGDRIQAASLRIYKARIALAQRDLAEAETAARAAERIFAEVEANASNRGVAEITLAQVLAEKGEREAAREQAGKAYDRLTGKDELVTHARRLIAAGMARVERLAGDVEGARRHYRQALEAPSDDSPLDDDLIRSVRSALAELERATSPSAPPAESD